MAAALRYCRAAERSDAGQHPHRLSTASRAIFEQTARRCGSPDEAVYSDAGGDFLFGAADMARAAPCSRLLPSLRVRSPTSTIRTSSAWDDLEPLKYEQVSLYPHEVSPVTCTCSRSSAPATSTRSTATRRLVLLREHRRGHRLGRDDEHDDEEEDRQPAPARWSSGTRGLGRGGTRRKLNVRLIVHRLGGDSAAEHVGRDAAQAQKGKRHPRSEAHCAGSSGPGQRVTWDAAQLHHEIAGGWCDGVVVDVTDRGERQPFCPEAVGWAWFFLFVAFDGEQP